MFFADFCFDIACPRQIGKGVSKILRNLSTYFISTIQVQIDGYSSNALVNAYAFFSTLEVKWRALEYLVILN